MPSFFSLSLKKVSSLYTNYVKHPLKAAGTYVFINPHIFAQVMSTSAPNKCRASHQSQSQSLSERIENITSQAKLNKDIRCSRKSPSNLSFC